ncbi:hypothetical protein [Pantoea stewartii]|uniref:hypothetical protein n=1 Tax=Pantoea stewartii TaxID=66269 RepID=UPI00259FFDC5|nr:hypothetical protein [Pantoea stewartii]
MDSTALAPLAVGKFAVLVGGIGNASNFLRGIVRYAVLSAVSWVNEENGVTGTYLSGGIQQLVPHESMGSLA